MGPNLTECGLGWGLPPYGTKWHLDTVWRQQTWAENWGTVPPFFEGASRSWVPI